MLPEQGVQLPPPGFDGELAIAPFVPGLHPQALPAERSLAVLCADSDPHLLELELGRPLPEG